MSRLGEEGDETGSSNMALWGAVGSLSEHSRNTNETHISECPAGSMEGEPWDREGKQSKVRMRSEETAGGSLKSDVHGQ